MIRLRRILDLDDARAEPREQESRVGSGEGQGEIEHRQAGQRCRLIGGLFVSAHWLPRRSLATGRDLS